MKINEVDINYLKQYLIIDEDDDDTLLSIILEAGKAYIENFTGQNFSYLNSKPDITIALLSLCTDLYENREFTVKDNNTNKIVNTILNMHKIDNLG
ncbi:head-tail connector protein [Clostridium perfringens]|uniref:head-tail connector protein n=1 Tax=Clostridium perfringens TaxID=1502 RepID=UPI00016BCE79|nr:head-tail connector protein [Clostridium perfringens]EDT77388.1 putative phage qlrg family protein, dna packaging [Clostridium perfringens NCTC 8239]EIF6153538.1 phage gp6-like head-tail connector protein [Clostridium perfringens]EJT6154986.1 phage gp6-like head-tail connector protein [Clostridium perfringens]ELC8353299.1 phage gp6-like head-tail connector protein [Clostridium perfringens]KAF2784487.1 hypothetical protein SV13_04930 [Clostridium perfringens]